MGRFSPDAKRDLTKSQRRRIQELAQIAHDRELSRDLLALEGEFARWRKGALGPHALCDRIREFQQGPGRQLFTTYAGGQIDLAVAAAIAKGIITEAEAGAEILALLHGGIELARWYARGGDEGDELQDE